MNMSDYDRGWEDCRCYRGEATDESEEYREGFNACLRAYHDALASGGGWNRVGVRNDGNVQGE